MSCLICDIGAFKHRLALQSLTDTQDSLGGSSGTWATTATVWGKVESMTGREYWQHQQINATLTHKMTVRYSSEVAVIKPNDRVSFDSRFFNITSIINVDEEDVLIEMLVTEVVSA